LDDKKRASNHYLDLLAGKGKSEMSESYSKHSRQWEKGVHDWSDYDSQSHTVSKFGQKGRVKIRERMDLSRINRLTDRRICGREQSESFGPIHPRYSGRLQPRGSRYGKNRAPKTPFRLLPTKSDKKGKLRLKTRNQTNRSAQM